MGKKKSKSGKQKQTKKKGGSSLLGKNGSKTKNSAQSNNDIRILCSLPKPRANKQQYNGLQSQSQLKLQQQTKQQHQNEKEDFDRQMNSLVERSRAAVNSNRRKSGRRRKHPESKLMQQIAMKPASFSLEKSTKQLYEETMQQMGQIMTTTTTTTTNNNTIPGLPPPTATSSLARAAAAIPSSERTPIISNAASHRTSFVQNPVQIAGIASIGNNNASQKQTNRNSFSALTGNDSDDDSNNTDENAEIARANTIRFAPASFNMASNSQSQMLPTKTPPTTPTTNHHFRHTHSKRATSLFSTIAEEEIEELQYQRQTGKLTEESGISARHLNSSYINATADDDDDL